MISEQFGRLSCCSRWGGVERSLWGREKGGWGGVGPNLFDTPCRKRAGMCEERRCYCIHAVGGTVSDAGLGSFEPRRARRYSLYMLLHIRFTYFPIVALDLHQEEPPALVRDNSRQITDNPKWKVQTQCTMMIYQNTMKLLTSLNGFT